MLPILQIGPLAIQTPMIILLIGIWMGLSLAEKYSTYRGIDPAQINGLVFAGLAGGILGGRIAFILTYPAVFLNNPISIISPNPMLFRLEEVLVFSVLSALVFGTRKKMVFWKTLDALTPLLLILWIAYSLANFSSGNDFGIETSLPWGISLLGVLRHPTQLYDLIFSTLALIGLWPGRILKSDKPGGRYFLTATAFCALSRFALAPLRGESYLLPRGFRLEQIIAWLILIACLVLLRQASLDTRQVSLGSPAR